MFKVRASNFLLFLFLLSATAISQVNIRLEVDASEAFRNIVHVKEALNVRGGGGIDLFYPKWIPGEHAPTGTINDMVNLFVTANGKPLEWRRDDVEMFAFHVSIPAEVREIEVDFDDVSQPGTVATANLARIKWNRLLVYPRGVNSDNVTVTTSLRIPADWQYATSLTEMRSAGNTIYFTGTNLTEFIDSPAIIGRYFSKVPLAADPVPVEMDIAGETADSIKYSPDTLAWWKNLVTQANLAFGGHHYRKYKFLLTVSDDGGSEGLEHHESSEDGVGEKALSDRLEMLDLGDLLGHEYAHSWNGKYRRPASLTTSDFEQPMHGELLWVYEGLTQYLGHVFPARSGVWSPEMFRDVFAVTYADMDMQSGRRWRPLVDTAVAVQYTYPSPRAWMNARRRVDYYYEGSLIWLEADVLIRQLSNGKLSLDDFLHKFYGGTTAAPDVVTYDLDEIVRTLNSIVPFDWKQFFIDRVYKVSPNAPIGGITNGGWTVVYNETPNLQIQVDERDGDFINEMYSIGAIVAEDGEVRDVDPQLAAAKAGLAPGMKIEKVNGAEFSLTELRKAVTATKGNSNGILVEAVNGSTTAAYRVDYTGGERFPHLVRDNSRSDLLTAIAKPR
jgi:predicted metalloprotease with PDZ domain